MSKEPSTRHQTFGSKGTYLGSIDNSVNDDLGLAIDSSRSGLGRFQVWTSSSFARLHVRASGGCGRIDGSLGRVDHRSNSGLCRLDHRTSGSADRAHNRPSRGLCRVNIRPSRRFGRIHVLATCCLDRVYSLLDVLLPFLHTFVCLFRRLLGELVEASSCSPVQRRGTFGRRCSCRGFTSELGAK